MVGTFEIYVAGIFLSGAAAGIQHLALSTFGVLDNISYLRQRLLTLPLPFTIIVLTYKIASDLSIPMAILTGLVAVAVVIVFDIVQHSSPLPGP